MVRVCLLKSMRIFALCSSFSGTPVGITACARRFPAEHCGGSSNAAHGRLQGGIRSPAAVGLCIWHRRDHQNAARIVPNDCAASRMVPWPPLLLLLASSAGRTEASNDMKARFAARPDALRRRHAGGARQAAADAQFVRRFYKKKPVRTKQPKPTPRPKYFSPRAKDANILLLMVEDLRRDHVVGDKAHTPHIDALAARADAVSFDRAFAQATWCAPSRASLLTGLEPYQNAAGEKVKKSRDLRQKAKLAGYEPCLARSPTRPCHRRSLMSRRPAYAPTTDAAHHARGADFSRGVFECLATQNRSDPRNARPKPTKRAHLRLCKEFTTVSLKPGAAPQADETIAQTAVAELGRLYNGNNSFLLACGFVRPHYPYVLPANLAARVHGGPDPGLLSPIDECGAAPLWRDTSVLRLEASVDDPSSRTRGRRGDERAGAVLEAVDWQRTTVIFTSDHGVFLGEHHLWEKLSLQEQVTRVPLIVAGRAVDKHKGPRRVSAPVELLDLYPTILGIAGVTPALKRTGRRLPHVRGAKRRKNGLAVWNDNARHLKPDSRRVAVSWKYAWRFEHTGLLGGPAAARVCADNNLPKRDAGVEQRDRRGLRAGPAPRIALW